MKLKNILELIGNTPVVRINKLFDPSLEVWIKLEMQNPGGSIKDRIALAMVESAEKEAILQKGMPIIEPTSGNTGIGLALAGAVKGYRVILVMPDSMSVERRKILAAYGARIELTPRSEGMKGAIARARELVGELGGWMPMQFQNPANPGIHSLTTAREIIEDFPEGLDYLITGVGTGGHITGLSRVLKEHWKNLKVFAVEPAQSPVISGGEPGPHPIQGIGAGFIPDNLDVSLIDHTIQITGEEAYDFTRKAATEEGLFVGISTGASLAAVDKVRGEIAGAKTLTFNYDTGERYLSVVDLF